VGSICGSTVGVSPCSRLTTAYVCRWEFFTTFSFELDVYSGKRPFRWAMIVCLGGLLYRACSARTRFALQLYFGSRWLGLGAVICLITSFNLTEYNCIVSLESSIVARLCVSHCTLGNVPCHVGECGVQCLPHDISSSSSTLLQFCAYYSLGCATGLLALRACVI